MKFKQIALALGLALGATTAFAAPQMAPAAPATPAAPAMPADAPMATPAAPMHHHRHHRTHRHHHHHMAKKMDHDADDMKKMESPPATPPKP